MAWGEETPISAQHQVRAVEIPTGTHYEQSLHGHARPCVTDAP